MDNINKQIRDIIESGNIGEYLPEFLYHATFSGSLDSIKENGLGNFGGGYKSPWSLSYDRGVYLDTDEGSAESFVEGSDDDRLDTEEVIILKIPTDKLTKSLVEIDFNNDWNMDMLDEIEFNAIEDYFSSITYFYDGVIPFVDLTVTERLNESGSATVDSEGNPLTPEQVKFFKDSKVRDDKGILLVVYHGSQNKNWDTFRYKRGTSSGRLNFGKAFYFTTDKEKATGYTYYYDSSDSGDLKVCYLNLVNPLIVDAEEMGVKTTYDEATQQMKDYVNKHKDVLSSVSYPYEVYMHMAKNGGHDGIIVHNIIDNPSGEPRPMDVYIAFQANQIKSITNKEPSKSKNINEEKESEDVELETIQPTRENVLNILTGSDEYFKVTSNTFDIEAGDDFYLLPDGRLLIDTNYTNDGTKRETIDHSFVDKFLADAGMIVPPTSRGSTFFEEITNAIAITDGYNFTGINLGKVEPTEEQYKQLQSYLSKLDYKKAEVLVDNKKEGVVFNLQDSGRDESSKDAAHIINSIKRYYKTGKLSNEVITEEIDHREVYKSLTFSESPKRGPIFISKDGLFVNMGEEEAHSRIFGSEDEYEADDYYILHDAYGLIKANSGNQIEPYPYIDIWKVPNPAQKEAIITWMYKLIEWDSTSLMVNTSQDNEIYDLTKMIPEDVYRDIIRNL